MTNPSQKSLDTKNVPKLFHVPKSEVKLALRVLKSCKLVICIKDWYADKNWIHNRKFRFHKIRETYDTIDRHGMWQMIRVYRVGGKLLKALQSFNVDNRACVRVGNDVSEWFPVNAGLRQGCVMSPWLFNVYMEGVVREVNVRVLGKGLELLSANSGRFEIN